MIVCIVCEKTGKCILTSDIVWTMYNKETILGENGKWKIKAYALCEEKKGKIIHCVGKKSHVNNENKLYEKINNNCPSTM